MHVHFLMLLYVGQSFILFIFVATEFVIMPDQLPSLFDFDDEDFFPKNEAEESKPAEKQPVAEAEVHTEQQAINEQDKDALAAEEQGAQNGSATGVLPESSVEPGKETLPENYIKPKLELPGQTAIEDSANGQNTAAFDKQIGNTYPPKAPAFTFEPRIETKAAEEDISQQPVQPKETKDAESTAFSDTQNEAESEEGNISEQEMIMESLPEWTLDKNYYTIGEVAQLFEVNVSHIRFWTTEFKMKPRTTRKGDRLYTPAQIGELRLIHHLVKVKKYTLKGAKEILKSGNIQLEKKLNLKEELQKLHQELLALKESL